MSDPIDTPNSTPETIQIQSGPYQLRGIFHQSSQRPDSVVLYVHGFASTWDGQKATMLRMHCQKRGWSFAAVAFRGHGDSDGTLADLTGRGLQEDLDAIAEFLLKRGVKKLYLVGSSMGGWAGGWFAVRHSEWVVALAGIAPAFSFPRFRLERLSSEEHHHWRTARRVPAHNIARGTDEFLDYALIEEMPEFQPALLASRWTIPLLVFHGMVDDVIPYIHSIAFAEQIAPGHEVEVRLLRQGDHRLQPFCLLMTLAILDFFERQESFRSANY